MTGGEHDQTARLQAALGYAARGIAVLPTHFPVNAPTAIGPVRCSCRRHACPAPARHPLGGLRLDDASTGGLAIRRWWTVYPEAGVGAPTGGTFHSIRLRHPANSGAVLAWLARHDARTGPVLRCGAAHEFLVRPAGRGGFLMPLGQGELLYSGQGGLVLLAPSRTADGGTVAWVRDLTLPLPDGDPLFETLLHIPDTDPDAPGGDLPEPDPDTDTDSGPPG